MKLEHLEYEVAKDAPGRKNKVTLTAVFLISCSCGSAFPVEKELCSVDCFEELLPAKYLRMREIVDAIAESHQKCPSCKAEEKLRKDDRDRTHHEVKLELRYSGVGRRVRNAQEELQLRLSA